MLWALNELLKYLCIARMSQNSCFPLANRAPCPHMYTHVPAWVINQAWFLLRVRDGATPLQSNLDFFLVSSHATFTISPSKHYRTVTNWLASWTIKIMIMVRCTRTGVVCVRFSSYSLHLTIHIYLKCLMFYVMSNKTDFLELSLFEISKSVWVRITNR